MRRLGYLNGSIMKPRQIGDLSSNLGSPFGYFGKGYYPPPPPPAPSGQDQSANAPTSSSSSSAPSPTPTQTSAAPTQAPSGSPQTPDPSQYQPPAPQQLSPDALAAMQAQFTQLQAQKAQLDQKVTTAPKLASNYTGGSAPTSGGPPETPAPTDEQKIATMASDYETQGAVSRASAAPDAAPTPSPSPDAGSGGSLAGWLHSAFFGNPSPSLGGFGQAETDAKFSTFNQFILPMVIAIGIIYLLSSRKNESTLRQPRKRR